VVEGAQHVLEDQSTDHTLVVVDEEVQLMSQQGHQLRELLAMGKRPGNRLPAVQGGPEGGAKGGAYPGGGGRGVAGEDQRKSPGASSVWRAAQLIPRPQGP
jgi:hypothetical protein